MCAVLLGATMSAKLNLPTKTLGTERFYYYEVGKNETIHDVATKIGVSKEDIIKFIFSRYLDSTLRRKIRVTAHIIRQLKACKLLIEFFKTLLRKQ